MRAQDRFWWVLLPVPVVCLAAAVALTAFWLPLISQFDGIDNGILLGLFDIILCIFALRAPAQAKEMRSRSRARMAALRGDREAIPRADIPTDPKQAPDISMTPLALLWRPTRAARIGNAILVMFVVAMLLTAIISLALAGIAKFLPSLLPGEVGSPDPLFTGNYELILGAGIGIGSIGGLTLAWSTLRGKAFGITAADDGVRLRSLSGRVRLMRWDDIRLLEVRRESNTPRNRTFHLYGTRRVVTWAIPARGSGFMPVYGASFDDLHARERALFDLIQARTGLVPRTFDKPLQAGRVSHFSYPRRAGPGVRFAGWLTLVVFWLLVVGAIRYVPLTTSLAWNLLFALVPLLAALVAAIPSLAASRPDPQAPAVLASLAASPPALAAPDTVFALAYARSRRQRLSTALYAAPFALMGLPVLLLLASNAATLAGIPPDRLYLPRFPTTSAIVLAVLLEVFVGIFGQLALIASLRTVPQVIIADAIGVRMVAGKHLFTIPWSRIGDIVVQERGGRIQSYFVRSAGESAEEQLLAISWSARRSRMRLLPPPDQMAAIMPDELAALVAKRGGKPIRLG